MRKQDGDNFLDMRNIGMAGLNTISDPQDISEKEVPDILNMVFDSGVLAPRKGLTLECDKPTGETADVLQKMNFVTSDGIQYIIVIYGNNFYLRDFTNKRWIKLNSTYTPASTTRYYGFQTWNNGLNDDRAYFGNGKDNSALWKISLTTADVSQLSAVTSFTVTDGARFPTSGSLVVTDGSTYTQIVPFTNRVGNTFTLTTTLGHDVSAGDSVTMMMVEKSGMQKGSVFAKFQSRLFVAGGYGTEINLYYSKLNDPEDFTGTGSGLDPSGVKLIFDGNGGITELGDFGEYLLVVKEDSLHKFSFKIDSTLGAQIAVADPVISGRSIGAISNQSAIKVNNSVYYPTRANGIYRLDPTSTGTITTVQSNILSQRIHTYIKTLNFQTARVTFNDQKIFWSCGTGTTNNLILMYDLIRDAWTKFNSWNAKDLFAYNDTLYIVSAIDGKIYKAMDGYTDNNNPYESYFYSKRYNFGKAATPKTVDACYLEGYITTSSEFFVTVLFNEKGRLASRDYKISGTGKTVTGDDYVFQISLTSLGTELLGIVPLGIIPESELGNTGIFRVYLSLPNKFGSNNIQLKVYSNKAGNIFGITGMGFNPTLEQISAPPSMLINPIN